MIFVVNFHTFIAWILHEYLVNMPMYEKYKYSFRKYFTPLSFCAFGIMHTYLICLSVVGVEAYIYLQANPI